MYLCSVKITFVVLSYWLCGSDWHFFISPVADTLPHCHCRCQSQSSSCASSTLLWLPSPLASLPTSSSSSSSSPTSVRQRKHQYINNQPWLGSKLKLPNYFPASCVSLKLSELWFQSPSPLEGVDISGRRCETYLMNNQLGRITHSDTCYFFSERARS